MVAPCADAAAIVIGDGGGGRPDGVSKADLMLSDERLTDHICGALPEVCNTGCMAVMPSAVCVPDGVLRTPEDPPSGGPLAGIDASLRALGVGDDVLVVVVSVDAPGVGAFLPALPEPALREGVEGRIVRDGDPEPFNQYLMGIYRAAPPCRAIDEAMAAYGSVRGMGVHRVLRILDVERVSVSADACRGIDTPGDVAWWETFLSN